jgi:hypothetical protein
VLCDSERVWQNLRVAWKSSRRARCSEPATDRRLRRRSAAAVKVVANTSNTEKRFIRSNDCQPILGRFIFLVPAVPAGRPPPCVSARWIPALTLIRSLGSESEPQSEASRSTLIFLRPKQPGSAAHKPTGNGNVCYITTSEVRISSLYTLVLITKLKPQNTEVEMRVLRPLGCSS